MDEENVDDNFKPKVPEMTLIGGRGRKICNYYTNEAHMALAFQRDCENFMNTFKNMQTFEFREFAKLFKQNEFMAIFQNFKFVLHVHQFLFNCFFTLVRYFYDENVYKKTGSFYMLYSLYFKQPFEKWVKIRLTQEDHAKLNELLSFYKENNIHEPFYIYQLLFNENAFHLCAHSHPTGLHAQLIRRINYFCTSIQSDNSFSEYDTMHKNANMLKLLKIEHDYREKFNKYAANIPMLSLMKSSIFEMAETLRKQEQGQGCSKEEESKAGRGTKRKKDSL